MSDEHWMRRALALAQHAETRGEVPVGAVLVRDEAVLGEGFNQPISSHDATAHAEIIALRAATRVSENYRLPGSTLYVTLEPCAMCAGALVHARVERVVIAAPEPRAGAGGSVLNVLSNPQLNHRCTVEFGLFEQESADLLRQFFRSRR
ncbi:tRNA-specific adenosine deaminase [Arenicella chitinivorans]|uniref:tRNA-specific adenosine deaminase n=1 Tax=Arenicella chitinivorans TaxID=1329800 RepID=A0A918RL21_9GAMM|nr:tRNA adenosine(34) deaminase TadA [Arenicella chitinivorans]GHA02313.1 tRNA-specific adenosine deaminase [Arenicella chitinivorans]